MPPVHDIITNMNTKNLLAILRTETHASQAVAAEALCPMGISEGSEFIRVHTNLLNRGSQVVIFWSQTI